MTTIPELIAELSRHGAELVLAGVDLRIRRREDSAIPEDLRADLRSRKLELRTYLEIERDWRAAIAEVANAYDAAPKPGWLDDLALLDAVGEAMRVEDRTRALEAIGRWRETWLELLQGGVK